MSLKEFDAKQFLLEKGERVGLGVALTLMVLMLIFSLFMPSKGFFSGSPAAKAEVLDKGAKDLEMALRTREPQPSDKPEDTTGRLIGLDTTYLKPDNYEVLSVFEPAIQESPARRPPKIYNLEESVVAVAPVLIDTYGFDRNFEHVTVLRDPDKKNPASAGGGNNPFQSAYAKGPASMARPGAPMNENNPLMRRQQQRLGGMPGDMNSLQGPGTGDVEYELRKIPIKDWNSQELTARQPRPLRVAVIGGSFPYRKQLEEFKRQLRLPNLTTVLYETLADKENPGPSFNFVGVEVQRVEVDAAGNKLGEWSDLPLAETYQLWLKHTFWPFQPEDPKYSLVKFDGLVLPLLRVFHADKKVDPTMMTPGMMMRPGMSSSPAQPGQEVETVDETKHDYPDVVAQLKKVQTTLDKLSGVQAAKIAAPKAKADAAPFDPFRPFATPQADNAANANVKGATDPNAAEDLTIPDYALVRLVDVNLEPGKNYQYRVRIKMNNPNYKRGDVASPEYKREKYLTSKEWFEIPQVAQVPTELKYYVVDERKEATQQEQREIIKKGMTAQSRLWAASKPVGTDPIILQFHRWVETTPINKDLVPVGSWAIADRVFVSRGEYIGRKVRVDLPIWKVSRNAYVLPADPQKGVSLRKQTTGTDVDFGFDGSPKDETILVDFEGGRVISPTSKEGDFCRTEVLMLSPDGKLLARNSAKDVEDGDRKERREKVFKRIEDIREGKAAE